jgi:protease I
MIDDFSKILSIRRLPQPLKRLDTSWFIALLILGGYSPDRLRSDDKAVSIVRDFVESGKSLFSICHVRSIV